RRMTRAVLTFAVATDDSGGAFVAASCTDGFSYWRILVQHVDRNGVQRWPGGVQVSPDSGFVAEQNPALLADGEGGVYVSWIKEGAGGLRIQRLAPDGSPMWMAGGLASPGYTGRRFLYPRELNHNPVLIADDSSGGYVVSCL